LSKSVHLKCPGKKPTSGFGLPPIAVNKKKIAENDEGSIRLVKRSIPDMDRQ